MKIGELIFKVLRFIAYGGVIFFVLLIIIRIPHNIGVQRTAEQVAKIHATKLTLADVMGDNLPPDPGTLADATIAGVDANQNGIRDDVELAIFEAYPNSAKTRAVLLQYALALQMEVTQPFINAGIVGEVANKQDRAIFCLAEIVPDKGEGGVITAIQEYGVYISQKQFNIDIRRGAHKDFYSKLKSGRVDESVSCDIELSSLTQ